MNQLLDLLQYSSSSLTPALARLDRPGPHLRRDERPVAELSPQAVELRELVGCPALRSGRHGSERSGSEANGRGKVMAGEQEARPGSEQLPHGALGDVRASSGTDTTGASHSEVP